MAFLIASPWNSFSLTLILIALIGLPWTLAFIALSMFIAILTGLLFEALVRRAVWPLFRPHPGRPGFDGAGGHPAGDLFGRLDPDRGRSAGPGRPATALHC